MRKLAMPQPRYETPLALVSIRNFDSADFLYALLECETVERLEVQAGENLDTIFQLTVDAEKEAALLVISSLKGGGIGDSPMRRDRPRQPKRALLGGRLIAD